MDPYLGEIRIVGFNFAPRGWALCNGQILSIAQNTALFSLLGTTYGGNGTTTFALPNFQDTAPMNFGNGPGLTPRSLGENGGSTGVTLINTELPAHTHSVAASNNAASSNDPTGALWAATGGPRGGVPTYTTNGGSPALMNIGAVTPQGQSQPHNNLQPYLTLNFVIALQGIYPTRP